MGWGGKRPGSGPKKNPENRPRRDAQPKVVRSEPKLAANMPVAETKAIEPSKPGGGVDPNVWMSTIGQVEEISRRYARNKARSRENSPFRFPAFPKQATPEATMAMDSDLTAALNFGTESWLNGGDVVGGVTGEGLLFLGYAYLSELAQRPEYRVMAETIADDATRKWIDFDVVGDERLERERRAKDPKGFDEMMADPDERKKRLVKAGKLDKVKALQDDQLRLGVKDRFYEQCRNDGFFGRSHIFLDIHTNGRPDDAELKTPIGDGRSDLSKSKVPKGSFKRLQTIEPMWSYPLAYNANDPLLESWYNPEVWYVMGRELHGSRLLTFIGHPVPDILKPAYGFGGLSLTQMAKPYVDIWLQTRQSVADLIHSFSVMCLMTDLSTLMQPGNVGALLTRAAMFNMLRDNNGLFVVNKNTEDFKNVSASLSGLHELQAQAQEHMACLPAGTRIETDRGQVPIEEVTLQDRVLTRGGFHPIKWVGVTGHTDTFIRIEADDRVVEATEGHPIWSESAQEFVNAENVSRFHRLLKSTSAENTDRRSFGEVDGGGKLRLDITVIKKPVASFIASCGKRIEVLFQRIAKSITKTMTGPITSGTISSYLRGLSIWPDMFAPTSGNIESGAAYADAAFRAPLNGRSFAQALARPERAMLGTDGNQPHTRSLVSNAQSRSQPSDQMRDSALVPVCSVPVSLVSKVRKALQPVYNIEVDGPHEFFANSILVHNSVHRIPLVKFTGIQPSGLNASSEGEIKVYDDTIMAYQSRFIAPNLTRIVNFEQLSLFGEVDPEITFRFEPLRELTQAEKGQKQKDDADRDQKYVDMGALHPGEVRKIIIDDKDLPYTGLDPDDVPDLLSEENMGLEPEGGRPQGRQEGDNPRQGATNDDKGDGVNDAVANSIEVRDAIEGRD